MYVISSATPRAELYSTRSGSNRHTMRQLDSCRYSDQLITKNHCTKMKRQGLHSSRAGQHAISGISGITTRIILTSSGLWSDRLGLAWTLKSRRLTTHTHHPIFTCSVRRSEFHEKSSGLDSGFKFGASCSPTSSVVKHLRFS
ncbi:hypothetical protein ES703_110538 [subsurface metagenome]